MSTQFLRIQKKQLFELKQHLEREVNSLRVIAFGDVHFLDIKYFLGGLTTLDCFFKAYKVSEKRSISL